MDRRPLLDRRPVLNVQGQMKTAFVSQLEAFRATIKCGTVSGAAGLLELSQPAISRSLARLEASLQITLFDRRKGRLIATPEALILLDHVERSFASFDKVRDCALEIRKARTGRLHIAAMPAVCARFLPGVIQSFKAHHPDVSITVEVQHQTKIEDWIFSQYIDLGIAELPLRREGLVSETFCKVPMFVIMRPENPLAESPYLQTEDLIEEPLISLMPGQTGRRVLDAAFQRAGLSDKCIEIETQNYSLICELVGDGLGVGIVDPFTASAYAVRGLKMVPLRPVIEFHLGLLQPEHRLMSRVASSFLTVLRAHRARFLQGLGLS